MMCAYALSQMRFPGRRLLYGVVLACFMIPGQALVVSQFMLMTLLDHIKYLAEEITSLYAHRWEIELRFSDINTTMGMEMLRTRAPEMIKREILMYMIAYNVVRLLMLKVSLRR